MNQTLVSAEEGWRDGEIFLKEVNLGASLKQRKGSCWMWGGGGGCREFLVGDRMERTTLRVGGENNEP